MVAGVLDAGAHAVAVPVADGGDGTLDVLLAAAGGEGTTTVHRVTGPVGLPVDARLGWLADSTAVVEMAEAAGLRLLAVKDITPLEGGLPVMLDGKIIGAIGVSGALSSQDAQVARAGVAAVVK